MALIVDMEQRDPNAIQDFLFEICFLFVLFCFFSFY